MIYYLENKYSSFTEDETLNINNQLWNNLSDTISDSLLLRK